MEGKGAGARVSVKVRKRVRSRVQRVIGDRYRLQEMKRDHPLLWQGKDALSEWGHNLPFDKLSPASAK